MICPLHYTYDLRHCFPSTPPVQGKDLTCHRNQFSESSCSKVNSSWGRCVINAEKGVCIGMWKRIAPDANVRITYKCESSLDGCKHSPVTTYGTNNYLVITTCCQTDYCNTPDYLMSFVNTSVLGKLYSQTPSVRSYV